MSPYVQTVELGGVVVLNLGQGVDKNLLPVTSITYTGREPDALWRADAHQRIERHRKADLAVVVRDIQGQPLTRTPVQVEMIRHSYGFGCFLDSDVTVESEDMRNYRAHYLRLFNKATTPVYWSDWGWVHKEGRERFLRQAQWLLEHDFPMRGHVLVWPSWRWLPSALQKLEKEPEELRTSARNHVAEVVNRMREFNLVEYDVMNEPRVNHDLMDILGREVMVEWFEEAHRTDDRQRLFINEYSIVSGGGQTELEQTEYEKTIRYLLQQGAPLGGIGIQGHMGEDPTPPARIIEILDRFAKLGLPIEITEFDIDIDDEAAQADYTRDFFTAVFSHPATTSLIQWGFWEGSHWKPQGAMFRKDWTPKPNAHVYEDLVLNQWWTRMQGTTDKNGRLELRGFLGDYSIRIGSGSKAVTVKTTLQKRGETVEVTLRYPKNAEAPGSTSGTPRS
jgi:GH35 family endo-1,4-beta-xylanase